MATIESNFESICINPNDDLVLYEKEIIRSRIEKFLYAICSLDTDDLPTPLSRIEELYNCLVTGEDIPTFTPLSRAEKFVMAMLGAYDVELLPTPISRSETLMKKIATGDNNLDDVDNLQSRYEFLLAYIIKAGGFNGGSGDFYYQLTSLTSGFTTIYDTFDMPVKNAVLRGQTLVNLARECRHNISTVENPKVWAQKRLFLTNVKTNTRYTLKVKMTENVKGSFSPRVQVFFGDISSGEINTTTSDTLIFTSPSALSSQPHLRLITTGATAEQTDVDFEILLLEGEHTDIKDIPFVDGMASVKMPVLTVTGKNLFNGEVRKGYYSGGEFKSNNTNTANVTPVRIKPNTSYVISSDGNAKTTYYDNNMNFISYHATNSTTSPEHASFMNFHAQNATYFQLEEGSVVTSYEPYKSTTVTIDSDVLLTTEKDHFIVTENGSQIVLYNEEVILRSNGDVYDELNLLTGKLTQRISENNEVLSEEVHRTVDLSTVDQDGKETELSTFDDITHVITSSEGLIPTGDITVATKNATDVISVMSLRMDDISNSQRTLEESANTQSDDIDVTMLGVTDIYEQLL